MNEKLNAYNERRKHEKYRKQARKRWAEAEENLRTVRKKGCARCGTPGPSEAHHLIPKSKWTKTQKRNDEHTTAHKRIPRTLLNNQQTTHILQKQGEAWANKWYPK